MNSRIFKGITFNNQDLLGAGLRNPDQRLVSPKIQIPGQELPIFLIPLLTTLIHEIYIHPSLYL